MPRMTNPLVIDRRSLAAFRVATAVCVLVELLERLPDVRAFYSDSGVLPRAELLAWFGDSYARSMSLALIGGSTVAQVVLFAAAMLAAMAMLVGYRTRVATVACWVLVSSIQLRNPFVVFGAGVFLRLLLFWGCFLPLGERFSLDSALRQARGRENAGSGHISAAAVALQLQVCLVFIIAALAKMANPAWADGFGVAYSLDYELLTTAFGQVLRQAPWLCMVLSYAVVGLELVGPALLFIPGLSGPIRMVTLLALGAMLLGFGLCLRVGLFPYVSMAGLAIFIPRWFWEQVEGRWRSNGRGSGAVDRWRARLSMLQRRGWLRTPATQERGFPLWTGLRDVFVVAAFAYVVVWNIGLWRDARYTPPEPLKWIGETFHLRQRWGMFTRLPSTGWFVIPGRLRDGSVVDLFQAGGPLPRYEDVAGRPLQAEPPQLVSATFRSVPWLAYFVTARDAGQDSSGQLQGYGRYLCRGWNDREVEQHQLLGFELIYMWREVESETRPHAPSDYQRQVLWSHDCFG